MALIAIVGDLHLGVRSGNKHFLDFQRGWIEHFLERCKTSGVTHIIQAGDFFDVRKSIDGKVLDYIQTEFKELVTTADIPWHVIVGNHDIYYRDSNKTYNSRILQNIPLISVYSKPTEISIDGVGLVMLPWIDDEIHVNLENILKNTKATELVGHLELSGFPMYSGVVQEHGLSLDMFKQFKQVWSGHYHTLSERQNIRYIGAPYHLTWADVVDGTNRGFYTFDTKTRESTLVKNEDWMSLFRVVEYDKNSKYDQLELSKELEGSIVKVIVKDKDARHLAGFVKMLGNVDLIDFRIIDDTITKSADIQQISVADLTLDTVQVFAKCIEDAEDNIMNKPAVTAYMQNVYSRASALTSL